MIRSQTILILILLGFASCERKKNIRQPNKDGMAVKPTTPIDDKRAMRKLIDSAIIQGNERAYSEVSAYYLTERQEQDFFYYAFMMANKNKSPLAHYHVYLIIAWSKFKDSKSSLAEMDSKTRNLAMYYLLRSYEMGYDAAKYELVKFFDKGSPIPTSEIYLKKFSNE